MKVIWALALKEIRDGLRNRWIAAAIILLGALAFVISMLGSAPGGSVKASVLDVAVVSLSSLSVYLVPLIALMLSYDSLVGEFEKGTMMLLLTYPVKRWHVIIGKFTGHMLILLSAITLGYGSVLVIVMLTSETGGQGWESYILMMLSTWQLGAVFISVGYLISVLVSERATAAGVAMAVWLMFVVIYDLVLFGVLMADKQQLISQQIITAMMLFSPTDSYRILNLSLYDGVRQVSGVSGIVNEAGIKSIYMLLVMTLWILLPLGITQKIFSKREL